MAPIRPNRTLSEDLIIRTLSEDLIIEILVRVPVKSLLCCQLVCKAWFSLIKHPAFVKSQLRHAITIQTDKTFINCLYVSRALNENKFALLKVDSRQIVACPKFPYFRGELEAVIRYKLIGSVNGIVCAAVYVDCPGHNDSISLWNPATRQYKVIPSYSVCYVSHHIRHETLGFGYDEVDHDLKVVRVVKVGWPPSFHAEVYSTNRNIWRKVADPIDIPTDYFDVCFNGFLCGTSCSLGSGIMPPIEDYKMVAFDLNKEVLNCAIKLPFFCYDDYNKPLIIEFKRSIAVIVLMDDVLNDSKIKMWMLDDDACLGGVGVEASWTPMFITSIGMPARIFHGFFSNGDFLLTGMDDLYRFVWILCNVDKKETKIVPFSVDMSEHVFSCPIYKYTESLVTVPGFQQVNCNGGTDIN